MHFLQIIGDIDQAAYKEFSAALFDLEQNSRVKGNEVLVELMSNGGEAHTALAFYSRIQNSKLDITVKAVGNVESAAVLILAAGDRRIMDRHAWVMVHEDSGKLSGNVVDLERDAKQMRVLEEQWANIFASVTHTVKSDWVDMHKKTTYMDADRCLANGLVDEIC